MKLIFGPVNFCVRGRRRIRRFRFPILTLLMMEMYILPNIPDPSWSYDDCVAAVDRHKNPLKPVK